MKGTAFGERFDRRAVLGLIAIGVPSAAAFSSDAAKLRVRDVVRMLMEAQDGRRPDFSHQDLSGLNLAELDFKGADLSHCNLFGVDLTGSNLEGANLSRAVLDRATLVRTRFSGATLQDASIRRPSVYSDMQLDAHDLPVFRQSNLARVTFTARLDGADFTGANLSEASFSVWEERNLGGPPTTGLVRCDFTAAKMTGIKLRGLSLTHSVFRNADLTGAELRDTDLSNADLEGATLARAKLDGAKLEGTKGLG